MQSYLGASAIPPACICGNHRSAVIWKDPVYCLFRCEHCSLMWVEPVPDQKELDALYSPHYFESYYQRREKPRLSYFHRWLDYLANLRKPGRLLDVGCGIGLFLRAARETGWNVCGVEPSLAARQFHLDGLPILRGGLEDVLSSERFDLITFWDVLAHVRDPLQLLRKACELLADDGVVLIKTPNRTPMDVAIARMLNPLHGGRGWLHIPAQLFHFSQQSLVEILGLAGFKHVEIHLTNEAFLLDLRNAVGNPKILGAQMLRLLSRALRHPESIIILAVPHGRPERCASLTPVRFAEDGLGPVAADRPPQGVEVESFDLNASPHCVPATGTRSAQAPFNPIASLLLGRVMSLPSVD
jgi:SAM-dependent methyltransferase